MTSSDEVGPRVGSNGQVGPRVGSGRRRTTLCQPKTSPPWPTQAAPRPPSRPTSCPWPSHTPSSPLPTSSSRSPSPSSSPHAAGPAGERGAVNWQKPVLLPSLVLQPSLSPASPPPLLHLLQPSSMQHLIMMLLHMFAAAVRGRAAGSWRCDPGSRLPGVLIPLRGLLHLLVHLPRHLQVRTRLRHRHSLRCPCRHSCVTCCLVHMPWLSCPTLMHSQRGCVRVLSAGCPLAQEPQGRLKRSKIKSGPKMASSRRRYEARACDLGDVRVVS